MSTERSPRITVRAVVIVLLTLSTVFSYWSVKDQGFSLYDDQSYVVNNFYVHPGVTLENLKWAMTTGYEGNWQPVTWVSHMLDVQLFGLDASGHHLHNLLIHLLSSILVYFLLRRLTGREGPSAFVAFVFALHPLHVESVAWVCQRKDLLAALFGFLAIWAYARYVDVPGVKRFLLVLFFFALGLMSKPIIVTLPCVLLLLDYWPLNRMALFQPAGGRVHSVMNLVLEKIPLFLLAVGSSIMTYLVQDNVGAIKATLPLDARLVNAIVSYFVYLRKSLWPTDLAIFYPHPGGDWPLATIVVSGTVIVAITLLVVIRLQRSPWFAVGWLWFLGTLVPMIGIIQIGAKAFADRYMYWPIVGLAIMAGWLFEEWWKHTRGMLYVKLGSATLVCVALMGLTIQQVGYWENDKTLFGRALQVTERNWLAHYTLGLYAAQHDDPHGAREHFEQTINIMPSFPYAHVQLGQLLLKEGEAEASIPYLQHALDKNIEVERVRMNLAIAFAIVGRYEESLLQFSDSYEMNPYFGQPHHNLGLTLVGLHQYDDAERYLAEALRLMPEDSTIAADLRRVRNLKVLQKEE